MKFNVVVDRVETKEVVRKRKQEDGTIVEEKHEGRVVFVRPTKRGGRVYEVKLWPEDDTPIAGDKLKLVHIAGERAVLMPRTRLPDDE